MNKKVGSEEDIRILDSAIVKTVSMKFQLPLVHLSALRKQNKSRDKNVFHGQATQMFYK